MEARYAFLADKAILSPDGKIHVVGGGVSSIRSHSYPSTHPVLSLVVNLAVTMEDLRKDHRFEIQLWGPSGQLEDETDEGLMKASPQVFSGTASVWLVRDLPVIGLPEEGAYEVRFFVDGELATQLPLRAELISTPPIRIPRGPDRMQPQRSGGKSKKPKRRK